MEQNGRKDSDVLIWDRLFKASSDVSDEDVAYYRDHPDQIDEVSAPINLHMVFLLFGFLAGAGCTALSKAIKYFEWLSFAHPAFEEFLIDLTFEIGVALIGTTIVTYVLVIVLNEQQDIAQKWRAELRRRIEHDAAPAKTE